MSDWISVKQKLPQSNMEVLVSHRSQRMDFARAKYFKDENIFVLINQNIKEVYVLEATHWMPYPHPPAWASD